MKKQPSEHLADYPVGSILRVKSVRGGVQFIIYLRPLNEDYVLGTYFVSIAPDDPAHLDDQYFLQRPDNRRNGFVVTNPRFKKSSWTVRQQVGRLSMKGVRYAESVLQESFSKAWEEVQDKAKR